MDTVIVPQMEVNTEEDLRHFLELARLEMRHAVARMDERGERIERTLARMDERDRRFAELLHDVQAPL